MGKRAKATIDILITKAVLEAKRKTSQEEFDKLIQEFGKKEAEFKEYTSNTQQELNRLQGEYRLLTSMISTA